MSKYTEKLISIYNNPINKFSDQEYDLVVSAENTSCGDEVSLYLVLENGVIVDAFQRSEGCAFCVGSACAVTELVKDKSLTAVKDISLENVCDFLDIDLATSRKNCLSLSLDALASLHAE